MEIEQMKETIADHEGRLFKVEVTQESQGKSITGNESRLDKLITQQNRIMIGMALATGAYLGTDKVLGILGKILGG